MTSREIAQEARLLVPTCRPQSSEAGQALLQKVAWLRRLFAAIRQEREGLSPSDPQPYCTNTSVSVSVVQQRYRLQSPQTHRLTSLATLLALE